MFPIHDQWAEDIRALNLNAPDAGSCTNAVVLSIVLIYLSDFFLANALFTGGGH